LYGWNGSGPNPCAPPDVAQYDRSSAAKTASGKSPNRIEPDDKFQDHVMSALSVQCECSFWAPSLAQGPEPLPGDWIDERATNTCVPSHNGRAILFFRFDLTSFIGRRHPKI
jgi:hypothetical protein